MALARTLIVEPKLVLLDEPLGALDQRTREKLQLFLRQVVLETKCTAILVTHDIREAVFLGDRICVFSVRPGRIVREISSGLSDPRTRHQLSTTTFEEIYEQVLESLEE